MSHELTAIKVNDRAVSDTRFKLRNGVALALATSIGASIFTRWLFGSYIDPEFWKFALQMTIPVYLLLYVLSIVLVKRPIFREIVFSAEGLHFPPLTDLPIPWNQIDAIQIVTDTQHRTGKTVQVDIKREYYRTIKSNTFDFTRDEPKRIFTTYIGFYLGVLDQSQATLEQLVDQFAPQLKKVIPNG
jgi:hypothetical protein